MEKIFQRARLHICEPSTLRTPVLLQARVSDHGTDFTALHTECDFVIGANPRVASDYAKNIRVKMATFGGWGRWIERRLRDFTRVVRGFH